MTSEAEAAPIRLERDGAIAHLVLDRPAKLNAVNAAMLRGLRAYVAEIAATAEIRAVVVRGAGRAFCAGADLAEVGSLVTDRPAFDAFLDLWHAAYDELAELPVPTLAAVHGPALAGGFELVQVCDFAILAEGAKFGDQHANYGLYAAGGGTQRLTRLVGPRQALWMLMSGQDIDPREAKAIGLVNDVVPADQVVARTVEMATLLAGKSAALNAELKRTARVGRGSDLRAALRQERPFVLTHMASEDARVGLAAFRARAVPQFPPRRVPT